MPTRPVLVAVPIALIGTALALPPLWPVRVIASPDGVDWQVAADADGCRSCHLGSTEEPELATLTIDGLPGQPEPGARYELTVTLEHPALRNAGFMLTIEANEAPAGSLFPTDELTETSGASARSTWEGSFPPEPGQARWKLVWMAPEPTDGPIVFSLWGNAGNDDLSPLGDHPVHRTWRIPTPP